MKYFSLSNQRTYKGRRTDAGFSLLELMIVIVIMSILAMVILPRIMDRPDQARVARAGQDILTLASALKLYRLDNLAYPSTRHGLKALVEKPGGEPEVKNWAEGGYVENLPLDPWGNPYLYLYPGTKGDFDLFSYGADGQKGGEGVDADIGNWQDSKADEAYDNRP